MTPIEPAYAYVQQVKAPQKEFVLSREVTILFRSIARMDF
jgi:hypothetical protein